MKILSLKNIKGHKEEFYESSERIINRSISLLKKEKQFNNDFEISYELYSKITGRNHFGKAALQCFMANIYNIQPLLDPEIKKIRYEISNRTSHDLIAYIYVRLNKELINFPFQGNRTLNFESIKKAIKLNNNYKPYKVKTDYNENFFIDKNRKSPVRGESDHIIVYKYFENLFKSDKYKKIIRKIYDKNVYDWANGYMKEMDFFPMSQHYALFSIAKTLNILTLDLK